MAHYKSILLTILILWMVPLVSAQVAPVNYRYVAVDPAGACSNYGPSRFNYINGKDWNCVNGTWAVFVGSGPGTGTMTSLTVSSPLTGGTITDAGVLGCQVASGSLAGCLSAADWTTFNSKGSGTVTSIVVSAPLTGGTITGTGAVGCSVAGSGQAGCLTAADWTAFNAKAATGSTNTFGALSQIFTDISTPTNPSAGLTKIYSKAGAFCALSPGGVETCTGGSGGGAFSIGAVNHIQTANGSGAFLDSGCLASSGALDCGSAGVTSTYSYVKGACPSTSDAGFDYTVCIESDGVMRKVDAAGVKTVVNMVNPMNTAGQIIVGGASGVPMTLSAGALDTVLQGGGAGVAPSYVALPAGGTDGCSGTTDASTYKDSTHAWGCHQIVGGGSAFGVGLVPKTANYTITSGDSGDIIPFNATGLTATLPSTMPAAGWAVWVYNEYNGNLNFTVPGGMTVNSSSTLGPVPQYTLVLLQPTSGSSTDYTATLSSTYYDSGFKFITTPVNGSSGFAAGTVAGSTDGTLAGNSDSLIPTQKAVKTYADTKLSTVPFPGASTAGGVLTTPCSAGFAARAYKTDGTPDCVSISSTGGQLRPFGLVNGSPATGTFYMPLTGGSLLGAGVDDARTEYVMSLAGTFNTLYVQYNARTTQSNVATNITWTLRKNGTLCNLTVAVAANITGIQKLSDTGHTCAFVAGDVMTMEAVFPSWASGPTGADIQAFLAY